MKSHINDGESKNRKSTIKMNQVLQIPIGTDFRDKMTNPGYWKI